MSVGRGVESCTTVVEIINERLPLYSPSSALKKQGAFIPESGPHLAPALEDAPAGPLVI